MYQMITPSMVRIDESNPYKKIEQAARTCYMSLDKITEESGIKMVKNLVKNKHFAMIEHQTFIFDISDMLDPEAYVIQLLEDSSFVHWTSVYFEEKDEYRWLVSMNMRAILECGAAIYFRNIISEKYPDLVPGEYMDGAAKVTMPEIKLVDNLLDLPDLTYPEIQEHGYFTYRIISDRGMMNELVRHRPCSFGQTSTRYVNYKEGIAISKPAEWDTYTDEVKDIYNDIFNKIEEAYGKLIELGQKPQQARGVLPLQLKSEIVVTANYMEWEHIFELRYFGVTGAPHPDIKLIAEQIYNDMHSTELGKKALEMKEDESCVKAD